MRCDLHQGCVGESVMAACCWHRVIRFKGLGGGGGRRGHGPVMGWAQGMGTGTPNILHPSSYFVPIYWSPKVNLKIGQTHRLSPGGSLTVHEAMYKPNIAEGSWWIHFA